MRYYQSGDNFSVTVTKGEVSRFGSNWPNSGMSDATRGLIFYFDANCDLIDLVGEKDNYDERAVQALMEDARKYAQEKRNAD